MAAAAGFPPRPSRRSDPTMTKDSTGTPLADGDSVRTTRRFRVAGTSVVLQRGTLLHGIRLTRTEFLRKV